MPSESAEMHVGAGVKYTVMYFKAVSQCVCRMKQLRLFRQFYFLIDNMKSLAFIGFPPV